MPFTLDTRQFDKALQALSALPKSTRRRVLGQWSSHVQNTLKDQRPTNKITIQREYDADQARVGSPTVFARIHHFGGVIRPSGSPHYRAPVPPLKSRRDRTSEVTGRPIRHLAIPIPGGARKNTRPRDYDNTFVFKSKKGNLLIAQRAVGISSLSTGKSRYAYTGRGSKPTGAGSLTRRGKKRQAPIRLLFVLKKQVRIRATRWADLKPADGPLKLAAILTREIKRALPK